MSAVIFRPAARAALILAVPKSVTRNFFVSFATPVFGIGAAVAQTIQFEQLLLPIVIRDPIPGALGSFWTTEIVIRNDSDEEAFFLPPFCARFIPGRFCTPFSLSPKDTFFASRFVGSQYPPTLLLNVPRTLAAEIFVTVRVRDISRAVESFGTEIPVIRQEDLHGGRGRQFALRGDFSDDLPATEAVERFRLEITAGTLGARYWAFAAITNNETQQVTVVTPP